MKLQRVRLSGTSNCCSHKLFAKSFLALGRCSGSWKQIKHAPTPPNQSEIQSRTTAL